MDTVRVQDTVGSSENSEVGPPRSTTGIEYRLPSVGINDQLGMTNVPSMAGYGVVSRQKKKKSEIRREISVRHGHRWTESERDQAERRDLFPSALADDDRQ